MKHQTYAPPHTSPEFAGVPRELVEELGYYPEGSKQHTETLEAITALALEGAFAEADLVPGVSEADMTQTPPGFNSVQQLAEPMRIPADVLNDRVVPLRQHEGDIELSISEYITDLGNKVLVADLREMMSSKLRKLGPDGRGQGQLDRKYIQDIKYLGDNHHPRNTVTGISGIGYTKVPSTKLRSYYAVIANPQGGREPVMVRLGDCGGPAQQPALYRALFAMGIKV